jgi:4-amino-4-deoxy-L-arabinose transferase-like glycosyltransferase
MTATVEPLAAPAPAPLDAAAVQGEPSRSDVLGQIPAPDRRRQRVALIGVVGLSLVLNTWALSLNGLGNQYYAAAARSMTASWGNFFFASFDPDGFISVDKPPVALWIQALSARLFGINSWSLLLPSALAGAGAVALLWITVRRRFGPVAATIAGLVLAVSPVNVAVNRLNLPEPFLVLFLVAAAWAIDRSLDARRWGRWLLAAGAFVGLAFNTKMLAGYLPVPALAVAVLLGAGAFGWRARLARLATFGASALAFSVPWLAAVALVPAGSRPYVGGSTDDTVLDLVFGYNGLGRIEGAGGGIGGPGGGGAFGGMGAAGGVFGGSPGPLRLLGEAVGGQVAWLLPVATLALVAGAWLHRAHVHRRAMLALWAGWLAVCAAVFSVAEGTFHAYYVSLLVPGLAGVVGIGLTALVPLVRRSPSWLAAAGGVAVGTVLLQVELSGRQPAFYGWMRVPLVLGVAAGGVIVAIAVVRRIGRRVLAGLAVGLAALTATPTAWAASEAANPVLNATLPQAGPRTGSAGSTFGSASSNGDPDLAAYLRAHDEGETWDLVVASAQSASGLIADEGISVMALGGFMGSDPATDLASIADMVAEGEIRLFQVEGAGAGGGGFGGAMLGGGTAAGILQAVGATCDPVTVPATGDTLYDCAGHADALAAAG